MQPVAVDATSNHATVSGAASTSFLHTPVGTPSGVYVGVVSRVSGIADGLLPSSVTYGGDLMSLFDTVVDSVLSRCRISHYYLGTPKTGAQSVAVTMPDSTSNFGPFAVTLTGDVGVPPKASTLNTGNSTLASVAPPKNVPAEGLVIAVFGSATSGAGFSNPGQSVNAVQIYVDDTGALEDVAADYRLGQYGADVMTHSVTTGAWAASAVAIMAGLQAPFSPRGQPRGV